MFIDDPGAGLAFDRQNAALPLAVQPLFQGLEQAVGQAFEGGIGHGWGGSNRPFGGRTTGLWQGLSACIPAALSRGPVGIGPQ
jgi:hypothetical protein